MKKSLILAVLFVFALAIAVPSYAVTVEPVKKEKSADKKKEDKKACCNAEKKEGCCKDKATADKGEAKACCSKKAEEKK